MAQRITQPRGAPTKKQQIKGIMNRRDIGQGLASDLWKYRNTSGYDQSGGMQQIQQRLFDQGVIKNTHSGGWFDPSVLRATPGGFVNLLSGVSSGWNNVGTGAGTGMVPDERLNMLRQKSNFNPEVAAGSQTGQQMEKWGPDWMTNLRAGYGAGPAPAYTPPSPTGMTGREGPGKDITDYLPQDRSKSLLGMVSGEPRPRTNVGWGGGIRGGVNKQPFQNEGRQPMPQGGGKQGGGKTLAPQNVAPQNWFQGGVPPVPAAPTPFLPMTPGFEAARRQLEDQLSAAQMNYATQAQQIAPMLGLQQARVGTNVGYEDQALQEALANRGVLDSSIYPELYQRDIATPYGRQLQDLALSAAGQYGDIASGLGGAQLGYNQGLMEALLNRAAEAPGMMPLSTPGNYGQLPPKRRVVKKTKARRGKGRRKANR